MKRPKPKRFDREYPNPCCGFPADAMRDMEELVDERPHRDPLPGDITICYNCGAWLCVVNSDTGLQRLATPADIAPLKPETFASACEARQMIRQRGRFWPINETNTKKQ